ncbi:MFS transporter [Rhodococcus sp. HM1]|uniref:MFS transporter n=1 Tax=Rhodococcus sp. HM1 TaxID=2937759 RepID=UPI00200ADF62|nr:MFS transporter [Rhodococcus sp. HM1]MCK8674806.1 MFS transporter [Rhodococcus sp. HM1]
MTVTTVPDSRAIYTRTPTYSWWVLLVSLLCFMTCFIGLNTVAVFGTVIQDDWGISATQLSLLTTASMVTFCVVPVFAGRWASRIGVKKIVVIGLLFNVVAGALIPVIGQSYAGLFVLRVLLGCCGGVMNASLATHASLWFPKNRRGFATGLLMGFLGVGFSITSFAGPLLLDTGMSWETASAWLTVVPSILCGALFVLTVKDFHKMRPGVASMDALVADPRGTQRPHSTRFDALAKPASLAEALRSSRVWWASLYGAGTAVTLYGLAYALPLFLEQDRGLSLLEASAMIGLTFMFKLVAAPIGGLMSDRLFRGERFQTNMIGAGLAGAMVIILPGVPSGTLTVYLCVMFLAASLYGGTYWAWAAELSQPQANYQTSGLIVTVSNVGAVLAAPVLGLIIDATGSATWAIVTIGVVGVLSIECARRSRL